MVMTQRQPMRGSSTTRAKQTTVQCAAAGPQQSMHLVLAADKTLRAALTPPRYLFSRYPYAFVRVSRQLGCLGNGASGGSRTSVFSVDRRKGAITEEDRQRSALSGMSWTEHGQFAARLWRRWLGYKSNEGEGGQDYEMTHEGRMCLPAMLLHPVKGVKLIYEDTD